MRKIKELCAVLLVFSVVLLSGCSFLGGLSSGHTDADSDGLCDLCGKDHGGNQSCTHKDLDTNGLCDDCGASVSSGSTGGTENKGEVSFPGSDESQAPEEWPLDAEGEAISVSVLIGESCDLKEYIGDDLGDMIDSLSWSSRCETIASVSDGVLTAHDSGRTLITALGGDEIAYEFSVTVEFMISQNNGFNISTDIVDDAVYKVSSLYEANRLLDRAVAEHKSKIKIDFSGISPSFDIRTDFDLDSEFGNHASFRMLYYESKPWIVDFEVVYKASAATTTTELTAENTSLAVESMNAAVRRYMLEELAEARADDYEGFAINGLEETMAVYNSEELWWAVEQGYKPVFPLENTKAELFYERAKIILREIVYNGMNDYEKVMAIYEYLVDAVSYDYDAFGKNADKTDTCYYLEGVFEKGRAVCDGKTKAMVLLCGIEGIPCVRAFGESRTGGAGHAWNYVSIDGVWYLIDTTEGDTRYSQKSDGIADFYGASVELVGYSAFLQPVRYLENKYVYTEMWAEIVENTSYTEEDSYEFSYLLLGDFDYDFYIDSVDEVEYFFGVLNKHPLPSDFALIFIPESTDNVFAYFGDVREDYSLDMQIFTTPYGEDTVYIAIFSLEEAVK